VPEDVAETNLLEVDFVKPASKEVGADGRLSANQSKAADVVWLSIGLDRLLIQSDRERATNSGRKILATAR
jgi:hypothetical protein